MRLITLFCYDSQCCFILTFIFFTFIIDPVWSFSNVKETFVPVCAHFDVTPLFIRYAAKDLSVCLQFIIVIQHSTAAI